MIALALAAALLAPPAAQLTVDFVPQGRAPWCSAAAVVMAGNARGAGLALKPLVRALPVHADGIAWVDLREHLAERLEVMPLMGSVEDVKRAVAAGVPPILSVLRGAGRHALVVTAYDRGGVQTMDPSSGPGRLSWAGLRSVWGDQGPLVVVLPRGAAPRGLPLARWQAGGRRYAAEAWARRAAALGDTPEALGLYDRAVAADPSFGAARYDRAVRRGRLGQAPAAVCPELSRAGRDGAPAAAVAAARQAFSCRAPARSAASSPSSPAPPRPGARRPAPGTPRTLPSLPSDGRGAL